MDLVLSKGLKDKAAQFIRDVAGARRGPKSGLGAETGNGWPTAIQRTPDISFEAPYFRGRSRHVGTIEAINRHRAIHRHAQL